MPYLQKHWAFVPPTYFSQSCWTPSIHKNQETLLGDGESVELNVEARALYSYAQGLMLNSYVISHYFCMDKQYINCQLKYPF